MAFALDLILGAIYLADVLLGQPVERFSRFINLDGEVNLPTWYASIQWFGVAVLAGILSVHFVRRSRPASWVLLLLPVVFLLFSLDEVAELHEGFGGVLDRLVLDVPRAFSALPKTGVLVVLFGLPFSLAMVLLLLAIRPVLSDFPGQFLKLVAGMSVLFIGAIGIEAFSNFVVPESLLDRMLVLIEETLELIGATLILWGAFDLGRDSGAISGAFESNPS